jgi:hypothetical protein
LTTGVSDISSGARAGAPPSVGPTATAVLLATARSEDGGPAAGLDFEGTTVVGRLLEQLEAIGIVDVHLITRPAYERAVTAAAARHGAELHACRDVAADLRTIAGLAREARGDLLVAPADVVTHADTLAALAANPRISSGILAGDAPVGRQFTLPARQVRGRIVSAGSAYHSVHRPNLRFLDVLRVGEAERAELEEVANALAQLLEGSPPADWQEHLGQREARWRAALHALATGRASDQPPPEGTVESDAPVSADAWALELADADEEELRLQRAAVAEDATSLLLVGLVRSNVHVRFFLRRPLLWVRPLSARTLERARACSQELDEERVRLVTAVKASDGFFTTFLVSPYSKYIARWCARRGFTPNQVTTVSFVIGLLAAVAMATGERWGLVTGAILLQLAFTADCVDGQLARYTRTFSQFGAWLDSVFDRAKEYAVFAGLAIGAATAGDPVWALAGTALALQTARHASDFAWGASETQVVADAAQPPLDQPEDAGAWAARRARERGEPAAAAPARPRSPASRALSKWQSIDTLPGVRWAKKIAAFPIGERFAVISLTAALWSPRTTFTVLLVLGGLAATYQHAGRALRTMAR